MAEEAKKKGKDPKAMIIEVMVTKSSMKQDVYEKTKAALNQMKEVLQELAGELTEAVTKKDPRLMVEYTDQGEYSEKCVKLRLTTNQNHDHKENEKGGCGI